MTVRILVALLFVVVAVHARTEILNRVHVPGSWKIGGHAPDNARVNFIIALKQRNLDILETAFWNVVTPGSDEYRQFKTIDEIMNIVAPPKADHDRVLAWLRSHNIIHIRSTRDALEVVTTVKDANRLFHTRYHEFVHKTTGQKIFRAYGKASMPSEISPLVNLVEGLSTFPIKRYRAIPSPQAQAGVIPQTLWGIYQFPTVSNNEFNETSQSVIEFQGQNYDPKDLTAYSKLVNIPVTAITKAHTVGPNDPTDPQLEASLDVDWMVTINPASTSWFWLEKGDGWLYQFVNHMFNTVTIPEVQSISYGWSESDQCDIDGDECQSLGVDSQGYVTAVNAEFQKIALRGTAIFVSSGDSGANGRTDPDCSLSYLKPDYPGCSPYITSVGATQLNSPVYKLASPPPICSGQGFSCASNGTEVAVSYNHAGFASGGGFSNYAPMPSYQTSAVTTYLKSGVALPPSTYFNSSNRGYPDVAAIGSDVLIYQEGVQDVGGTSASSPSWAAVAGVMNHYAKLKSGKALGFLNPFLYQMYAADPTTFHDITVGDNKCTEDGCSSSCKGYLCYKGWDPVTGLGSPNLGNIIKYIQNNL